MSVQQERQPKKSSVLWLLRAIPVSLGTARSEKPAAALLLAASPGDQDARAVSGGGGA